MFGLVYTALVSIGLIFHSHKEEKKNKKCKLLYQNPDGMTYTDSKGRSRLLSNDKLVFYTKNKNGDYILEDESGYVYKNFSEDERKENLNIQRQCALNNQDTTFCIDDNDRHEDWVCQGKRFQDLKTGEIYVIRCINYKYYYMNILNGMLVRETDWQKKKDELYNNVKWYSNYGVNIESFNEKQKDVKNQSLLFRDFEYSFLCNYYK